jgi:hypothetical protein
MSLRTQHSELFVGEGDIDQETVASPKHLGVELPGRFKPLHGLGTAGRILDGVFTWMGYLSGLLSLRLALFVSYDVMARNGKLAMGELLQKMLWSERLP